ncbi:MAG: hypothetical protein E7Y34_02290, partial [Mycoplasma sp.]|nr:hypothetical protein [Mycoplasma sp.]
MKTQKTIVDTNLYLGSQLDMPNDEKLFYLRTTDIYFYLFNSMSKYKNFKFYKNQLILNLKDPFFIDQINFNAIVAGIKFLKNRDLENEM